MLAKLALSVAVLPHTTVPLERIFSQLKDFKTNKRNRLSAKNIEASLLVYQAYGEDTGSIVSREMFEKYKIKYQNDRNSMEIEEIFEKSFNIEEEEEKEEEKKEEVLSEISTSKSERKLKRRGKEELVKEDIKKTMVTVFKKN